VQMTLQLLEHVLSAGTQTNDGIKSQYFKKRLEKTGLFLRVNSTSSVNNENQKCVFALTSNGTASFRAACASAVVLCLSAVGSRTQQK
jgi:hypothetical protein